MSLSGIMTGLEALAPTFDSDVTVNVWEYDAMKDTLNESECPVRLIGINDDKQGAELEVTNLNNKDIATWSILDRLYIMPVNLDMGLENYNHKILDYMESYMAAVSANPCIGLSNGGQVVNVSFSAPYHLPFPNISGGVEFWVVDAVVTVEEYR